ncbi:MAG: hypothetical protein ABSG31_17185 [Tepidisphaeraceae bacterium]|jgi:hypothetical protein
MPRNRIKTNHVQRVLEKGMEALVKNGDIDEKTARSHIVGYLAQILNEAGIEKTPSKKRRVS